MAGRLQFSENAAGLVSAVVSTDNASAEIFMQGAHITQWVPRGLKPVLFTSARSEFVPGKAIRGGVPIIFPWFGARGAGLAGPSHGFARTALWRLEEAKETDGTVEMKFRLEPADVDNNFGFVNWSLDFRIVIGRQLQMDLQVSNTSNETFSYEEALHSYFAIGDIAQVSVEGLRGVAYLDKVDGGKRKLEAEDAIRFSGETDRVYLDTEGSCVVGDGGWRRRVVVEKRGSRSTVVWNPWSAKAKALRDLGAEEWRQMVCVESANVAENAVTLKPGGEHLMSVFVSVE